MKKKIFFQFVKFSFIGVINTIIHVSILYVLVEFFFVYYLLASFIGFLVAVVNSFILNSKITFKSDLRKKIHTRFSKFLFLSVLATLTNISVLYVLTDCFGIWYIYSQIIAIIFSLILNFFGNKYWVFKNEN